jgi:hypothetical protein
MEQLAAFFNERGVAAPYVDTDISMIAANVYIPGARPWRCEAPDPATPEWVAISTYKLAHQSPNCRDLLRYPSWEIGGGAVMVFHLTDSAPSADLKTE